MVKYNIHTAPFWPCGAIVLEPCCSIVWFPFCDFIYCVCVILVFEHWETNHHQKNMADQDPRVSLVKSEISSLIEKEKAVQLELTEAKGAI